MKPLVRRNCGHRRPATARPEDLGERLGTLVIHDFVRFIETRYALTCIIADPVPDNAASIQALLACGFRRDEEGGLFVRE